MVSRILFVNFCLFLTPTIYAQEQTDDHGYPLPKGAIARLGDLRFAQPNTITAVALSPDGKLIATSGVGLFIWDAEKGTVVRHFQAPQWITHVTFSKDGNHLAACAQDGAVCIWTVDGKVRWQAKGTKSGWHGHVTGLRFINDGELLAVSRIDTEIGVSSAGSESTVQLWDVATGNLKQSRRCEGAIYVSLSPTGQRIAWLTKQCVVQIRDATTDRLIHDVKNVRGPAERIDLLDEGHHLLVKSTYFSRGPEKHDEKGTIVVTSEGNHAIVDVENPSAGSRFDYRLAYFISRPIGERRYVDVLAMSPDGKSVYLQDEVGMMRRDVKSGKILQERREGCVGLAFFPDGKRAVMARGSRLIVCDEDLKPSRPETEHSEAPRIHYQADGKLVALRWHGGRLNIWDPAKRQIVGTMKRLDAPLVGRTPCSYDRCHKLFAYHNDDGIVIHDLLTNRQQVRLKGMITNGEPWGMWPCLSSDGRRVLVSSPDKDATLVRWFDTKTGQELGRRRITDSELFPQRIRPVEWYADDGSTFGYVAPDGRLALVQCSDKVRPLLLGIPEWVLTKDVAPSSKWPQWEYHVNGLGRFVVASRRREFQSGAREYVICDGENGRIVRRFILQPPQSKKEKSEANWHWHGVLSTDSRVMAVVISGNEIGLFDTLTGRMRSSIRSPSQIESLDFSPDRRVLATSCSDTSILLWDLERAIGGAAELPLPQSTDDAEKLWQMLGDPDPRKMASAFSALVRVPKLTMATLQERLRPAHAPSPDKIAGLVEGLDSNDIKKRQAASQELAVLAEHSIDPLFAARANPRSLEHKRRIEELLTRLAGEPITPNCLRELRGLELLENLGTTDARDLVALMASCRDNSWITREARLILSRWR